MMRWFTAPKQSGFAQVRAGNLFTCLMLLEALCFSANLEAQGTIAPVNAHSNATKGVATVKSEAKPVWKDLNPAQQAALKPLASHWAGISEAQKRKWLAVSKNYPALAEPEQQKLHSRMTEWVSLSQQQRNQARLNFAETKTLSPSDKAANWAAYQALTPQEKQKLASAANPAPAGAAVAVRPVNPEKLAQVPVTRHIKRASPELVTSTHSVDQNTLLPKAPETNDPASVQKN
jgi:hypothetical protein